MLLCMWAWELLPKEWKHWWSRAYADKHGRLQTTLLAEESVFSDVTATLDLDRKALERLVWVTDIKPRELSLVLAEIKCPAGCCEFKHKANRSNSSAHSDK